MYAIDKTTIADVLPYLLLFSVMAIIEVVACVKSIGVIMAARRNKQTEVFWEFVVFAVLVTAGAVGCLLIVYSILKFVHL